MGGHVADDCSEGIGKSGKARETHFSLGRGGKRVESFMGGSMFKPGTKIYPLVGL